MSRMLVTHDSRLFRGREIMRSVSHAAIAAVFVGLFAGVFVGPVAHAVTFTDDFNTAASHTNFLLVSTDPTSSYPTYGYDYSAFGIPSAPNSGDASTLGLRLDANFFAPAAAEGVTLHTLDSYSGDYVVKFDAWLNCNGPFPDGGTGSTNYLTAGVGGNGVTNNFVANTGHGGWTAVNPECGSGVDYRLYNDDLLQGVATAQYAAGTAANARNGLNGYYNQFGTIDVSNMPVQGVNNGGPAQQSGTSFAGSFGMDWHVVQLIVDDNGGTNGEASMTWMIDNLVIGTLDAGLDAFDAVGAVTLGYSDPTTNQSDNPPFTFALFDNLSITTSVPEPSTLGVLAGIVCVGVRRRRN
ncbi:MAG TPA: PEP-CTERM sorting domain-containing protein [Tepidisphaeraceae bacterium]|nr:PEP-CTERM sorting domain-containing protein [Tepidisphaeraceae bacterium]